MTIVTQLLSDKKYSKQQEPLVKCEEPVAVKNVEEGSPIMVSVRSNARRVSSTATVIVFLTALVVLSTGIIGGIYLYKQFAQVRFNCETTTASWNDSSSLADQLRKYQAWCMIPMPTGYDSNQLHMTRTHGGYHHDALKQNGKWDESDRTFMGERIEIDIEYQQYEQIEVPDFSHGRKGRFIHDFSVNMTGIIDLEERRCFVMPLNRSMVLPPHSLFDLVVKMRAGYYDVDTGVVRETTKVIIPPVSDYIPLGYYITQECASMPTYYLERVHHPVYKRSLGLQNSAVFVEFAGNKISEVEIINLEMAPGAYTLPKK